MLCIDASLSVNDTLAKNVATKRDHRPLVGQFVFKQCVGTVAHKRRVVEYDHNGFSDLGKCSKFVQAISDLEPICVEVENSSHCHIVEQHIHDSLVECFPVDCKHKKHEFLSDHTFQVIMDSQREFHNFVKYDKRFEKSPLFAVFGVWKGCMWRCKYKCVYGFGSKSNLTSWFSSRAKSIALSKQTKGLVALEKLAEADSAADDLEKQFNSGDIVGMHKSVGRVVRGCKSKNNGSDLSLIHI